jgi:hypothetical protein
MTYWSMKTQFGPGNYRRNGDSGKLLSHVFQALLCGLPSPLIDLWSANYWQVSIVRDVWNRLGLHRWLQDHPQTRSTISIAAVPCHDPAVSSFGDC